jgi:stage II sporulation protein R
MKKERIGYIGIGILVCAALMCGILYTKAAWLQHDISEKVLRFHVLANSDDEADQNLKLAVRDAVGSYMQKKLAGVDDLEECEQIVNGNLDQIREVAAETIAQNGYDYDVTAELEYTSFPVKSYGSYTFPAGEYEALRVVIGEGKGHNWWCVMYPNMCFSGSMYEVVDEQAGEKLREVLTTEEYEKVLAEGNYQIQLKYFSFLNPYLK